MREILPALLGLLIMGGLALARWLAERSRQQQPPPRRKPRPPAEGGTGGTAGLPPRPAAKRLVPARRATPEGHLPGRPVSGRSREVRAVEEAAGRASRSTLRRAPHPEPEFEPSSLSPAPAPVRVERVRPEIQARLQAAAEGSYVGDLLRRDNLARAFVLSEIFGPPKALRDE